MRKSDKLRVRGLDQEKTFGEAFGDLIRQKRGQEGLTQRELAIRAFDDESKVRRIIELENGAVRRPQTKTVDALVVYFAITGEELDRCRRHGLFTAVERAAIGLSRELLENLAVRFEHDNPDAPDSELIDFLKGKATELNQLKRRLAELENSKAAFNNQITAANNALEVGRFDEADEILAAAEEIQQEDRTLKEVSAQSRIRFTRGDAALFSGQSAVAASHYIKASEYVAGFVKEDAVRILDLGAGRIYELERRKSSPNLTCAIDLTKRSLELISTGGRGARWAQIKYHLALLQQSAARGQRNLESLSLLDDAIRNALEALTAQGDLDDYDCASLRVVLANSYLERGQRDENKEWKQDLKAAIDILEEAAQRLGPENSGMHRCHVYNNISIAYRYSARRTEGENKAVHLRKAKQAVVRAIDLSAQEGIIDIWSAAQYNLGGMLAEAAATTDEPKKATFLRIQAIAAFHASAEAYPEIAFNTHLAQTQLALGRVLLDLAHSSDDRIMEVYLIRSISAYEMAARIFGKDTHLQEWSEAQYCIGLAFLLHSDISEQTLAEDDLKKALSYFAVALPGYRSLELKDDLKKLRALQRKAKTMLKNLQDKHRPKAA
jgi:transcriptional regulator with XRE-family HTH domain